VGGGRVHVGFWWGNLREEDHLECPGIRRRVILKWICKKWDGGGFGWGYGQVAGSCECGSELQFHKIHDVLD
jgi:hypothetical protein